MKAAKRRKLEAAGWRVGSADDFLANAKIEKRAAGTYSITPRGAAPKLPSLQELGLKHHVYGGDGRAAWLIVRDPCAGCKNVYTVYRISLIAHKEAHVIGRELPLPAARRVVRKDMETVR